MIQSKTIYPILVVVTVLFAAICACSLAASDLIPIAAVNTETITSQDTPAADNVAEPSVPTQSATPAPIPSLAVTATPTLYPSETPIIASRFAVIGDYGLAGKPERDVANLVKEWKPEFIITTGDNNYPDGMPETVDENIGKYFHAFISPYIGEFGEGSDINRFFPTMGNHDWSITGGKTYFDYFTLPGNERYYDFIWGPVHLFAIDSDSREPDGVGRTSIQALWLKDKLAASVSPWKIVYMHHPPYSSSQDGSTDWMQWPYKEWGATVVLSGHSHVYERIEVDGFTYIVNGLGGGPRYDFNDPIPGSQVRFREDYGAMLVEATLDQITFQFVTRGNQVIDTYVIDYGN